MWKFALATGMSATDAAIRKKIHGSGTTALIILNEKNERYYENS